MILPVMAIMSLLYGCTWGKNIQWAKEQNPTYAMLAEKILEFTSRNISSGLEVTNEICPIVSVEALGEMDRVLGATELVGSRDGQSGATVWSVGVPYGLGKRVLNISIGADRCEAILFEYNSF
jgi:hypothetical protein